MSPNHRTVDGQTRQYMRNKNYHRCSRCGISQSTVQIHHIKAVADGGTNEITNLDTLCDACHVEWHAPMGAARLPYEKWLRTLRVTYPLETMLYAYRHYGPGDVADVMRRYATRPYGRKD